MDVDVCCLPMAGTCITHWPEKMARVDDVRVGGSSGQVDCRRSLIPRCTRITNDILLNAFSSL